MKKFIRDLLSDNGAVSSTRFVYVIGHLVTFFLVAFLVLTNTVDTLNMSLISIVVGTLNSTKLIQKSQENKTNPPEAT